MQTGAITGYIDVAQLSLYAFWIFFAGLILYLRREDRREGYPLVSDRPGAARPMGEPGIPKPKTFILRRGGLRFAPRPETPQPVTGGVPVGPWPGAPLQPTGNPMLDCIGPASYANRADVPDMMYDSGEPKMAPMRIAGAYHLDLNDADPRGMTVLGTDNLPGGVVVDIWLDRAEMLIRYLEVETMVDGVARRVLLPMTMACVNGRRRAVTVDSIMSYQFALVPPTKHPEQVTLLEEDKIMAYYGSGHLYAKPSRLGPLL